MAAVQKAGHRVCPGATELVSGGRESRPRPADFCALINEIVMREECAFSHLLRVWHFVEWNLNMELLGKWRIRWARLIK